MPRDVWRKWESKNVRIARRQAVRQSHSRRRPRPLRHRGLPQRFDPQDRRAHRVQPGRHLQLLPEQGRHLLRARRGGLPPARRQGADCVGHDDPLERRARRLVGLLRVLQGAARVLRADVRRSLRAADHRAVDRHGGRPRHARRLPPAGFSGASTPASFAPGTNAEVAMHLVWGALTGPAVIGSGCRLAPGEDPDALARDVLELVIAGLRDRQRHHVCPVFTSCHRTSYSSRSR